MQTLSRILDAAENSNWAGVHALHRRYCAATGRRPLPGDVIIPAADLDAAIDWAKCQLSAARAIARVREMNAQLSPETRQVMRLKGMIQ